MAYTALYRKYRPETFQEVAGQEHIVVSLRNQIISGRIGHAYLFCGTRGTGKTSIAKILARAVNCESPQDGDPCGVCDSCRAIAAASSMNVVEIDAASNNGVDNIREIRSEVAYPPTEGRYRVYIIDEVHMLSAGAFNALLKTLEEPPSYVIFILATTEAHKIPATILSRCQRFDFRRLTLEEITGRLQSVLAEEGITAQEKAIRYIARKADGGMRDALSLTDQCVSYYMGQTLTYEKVLELLGSVDTEDLSRLLRQVIGNDVGAVFAHVDELMIQGRDISQLVTDFTWYLRNLLLLKASEASEETLDVSGETLILLREEAAMVSEETLMRFIREMSALSSQLRYATNRRVLLELSLIRLCRPQMESDRLSIVQRLSRLEEALENGTFVSGAIAAGMAQLGQNIAAQGTRVQEPSGDGAPFKTSQTKDLPKAVPQDLQEIRNAWNGIIADVDSQRFAQVLKDASLAFSTLDGMEDLLIVEFKDFLGETYSRDPERYGGMLSQLIAQKTGKQVRIRFTVASDQSVDRSQTYSIDSILKAAKERIHMEIETEEEL